MKKDVKVLMKPRDKANRRAGSVPLQEIFENLTEHLDLPKAYDKAKKDSKGSSSSALIQFEHLFNQFVVQFLARAPNPVKLCRAKSKAISAARSG
eukprot:8507706-Pyramimonas_sp.AAC.1